MFLVPEILLDIASAYCENEVDCKLNLNESHIIILKISIFFQESHVTPVTHFAFRILEQIALKGSKSRSRLILHHVSISLVMHLVKILPDMFSMSIVSKLFDVSTSGGRKNMAKVMCLLRTVQVHQIESSDQSRSAQG